MSAPAHLRGSPDPGVVPGLHLRGNGAGRRAAFETQRAEVKPPPPVSGIPVRSAAAGTMRTRRHSSTVVADCAHFHREEVPAGNAADRVSEADAWEQAAPPALGFKRVSLETFHSDIIDPSREQNLVSLLMTEIAAHQTDASRFLRGAGEEKGKRSRCTLWIITVFIYCVQIGAALKLLGNGRSSSYNTSALVVTFSEGLGNIYNLTALNTAVAATGEAGQPNLFSVFDGSMPVERQFSETIIQSIMMVDYTNLQKEQLMHECHAALVDTHHASAAACAYRLSVCNTYKGVLNKIVNMFAGGFVICGIVFHELFGMLTMEYPVVLPVSPPHGDETHSSSHNERPSIKYIWVLYVFLGAHLCLVITCVTACMVRVYGMGNDFWSVIESIVAAFLILDIDDKALPYIKSRVLARARGGRRRLVLSKIKKSVNLIKAANMFRPRPKKTDEAARQLRSTWAGPKQIISRLPATVSSPSPFCLASDTQGLTVDAIHNNSVANSDENARLHEPSVSTTTRNKIECVAMPGNERHDAADIDLLSAELGLVKSSGSSMLRLEKETQLRTALSCKSCNQTSVDKPSANLPAEVVEKEGKEEPECLRLDTCGVKDGTHNQQSCWYGCCDDLPVRKRMCANQLHRDAESCKRFGRWIYKLLTCCTSRSNSLMPFPVQINSAVASPSMLSEITYYTIGVRGDSRLPLLYIAQLLFASPIMWSCWNACVDVDVQYPWVKRAAFLTTWWMTPLTTAMATTSVAREAVLRPVGLDSKTFWPALLGAHGRLQLGCAATASLCIAVLWCGVFWAATNFSAWFARWV